MRESWYDVAQICLNGHVTNNSTQQYPDHNKDFCDICGDKTITNCQECGAQI